MKHFTKKLTITLLTMSLLSNSLIFAIENPQTPQETKKAKFSWFRKKAPNEVKLEKNKKEKKVKKARVEEVVLPPVLEGRPKIARKDMPVMSIEECVEYALSHNPNLGVSLSRIEAAKSGIGQARSNYAPRLTAKVSYNHNDTGGTMYSYDNSAGFNVGISEMIWDFGRTTAQINMAKYDTQSAEFDYEFDVLTVIYNVKINYFKVLSALANLDIYEQNVRIQTLNYERSKAMFEEGLKSKIDVVNAEANLADAKIQLVEGQNNLQTAIIALKNSMYFQEEKPFIVKNTENFGFLKADYRAKVENLDNIKQISEPAKKTADGLILLTAGIKHKDIIQNFEFKPWGISKQEAVDRAMELRPDLKSNRMLVSVQEESLKAIKRQYAPQIDGSLTWGYTKNERRDSSPLQVGVNIGIGSLNPYGIYYQTKEGESYLDIALNNVNIAKSDIYWEVQTNYVNMRQLERKIPLMNAKVKATLENFELADGRYSVGLNNYVELQDALTNYNNAQLSYVEAVFNYNVARETLLKSMGVR